MSRPACPDPSLGPTGPPVFDSSLTQSRIMSSPRRYDRAARSETTHIRDRSWLSDDIAKTEGLDLAGDGLAATLWSAVHQSFALTRWVAERKFGPHFVAGRTPIGNIRLTTFFAGEHEVRIIDPDLVEFFETHGCQVERPVLSVDRRGRAVGRKR